MLWYDIELHGDFLTAALEQVGEPIDSAQNSLPEGHDKAAAAGD
jgi:hypothetical protein